MCMYAVFALDLWAYFYQYVRCKTRTLDCLESQCQPLTGTICSVQHDVASVTNGLAAYFKWRRAQNHSWDTNETYSSMPDIITRNAYNDHDQLQGPAVAEM